MAKKKQQSIAETMPTGISGFDLITSGGLPRGGITVVLGGSGSGKTIFGAQALVTGVRFDHEAGLFVAFEESAEKVLWNARHFDWNLPALQGKGVELIDAQLSESVIQGGEFDLVGLLAILGAAAKQAEAKRIVFDGIDVFLGHLGDPMLVRREIFRLREWLYQSGMTGIITAKGDPVDARPLPEYGFLEFMADCVVSLHHRLVQGTAFRTLRVSKYRGRPHSTNEFPIVLTASGIEVADTATDLDYPVSHERLSSGVERLDTMLSGGYYRGSSTLISGAPGTAKTTLAAAFADAACKRGEHTLYVSFDDASNQLIRNVASVGIRLEPHALSMLLSFRALRTRSGSPESHVAQIRALLDTLTPQNLIIDPISSLNRTQSDATHQRAAFEILDLAKRRGITTLCTSLLGNAIPIAEETPADLLTIVDTWMHVSYLSQSGERNRALAIIKSRGTGHSNQVRELVLSDTGITLADVYTVGGDVLMGTRRWEREKEEQRSAEAARFAHDQRLQQAEDRITEAQSRMEALRREHEILETDYHRLRQEEGNAQERHITDVNEIARRRGADKPARVKAAPPPRASLTSPESDVAALDKARSI